jgi:1-acyl-sn-glycerol-3-phosphate acyltransferase
MMTATRTESEERAKPATLFQRVGWVVIWWIARVASIPLFRLRTIRRGRLPAKGGVLIIANHQSYLDPPLVTMAVGPRRICFLARSGLFRPWWLRTVIRYFNAHPLKENGHDPRAMRTVLALLEAGEAVLVFPEGSRSFDGSMTPFKRGIALLIKRAKCPVAPVAIEGAFDAWPRTRKRPALRPIATMMGALIPPEDLLQDEPDVFLDRLARQIDGMRLELRGMLRARSGGRYPPPGPGDRPLGIESSAVE